MGRDCCPTPVVEVVMNTPVMSLQILEKKIVNYLKYVKVFNSCMERKNTLFLTVFCNIHLLMKIFTNKQKSENYENPFTSVQSIHHQLCELPGILCLCFIGVTTKPTT